MVRGIIEVRERYSEGRREQALCHTIAAIGT
jgi:hypothetical protein